MENNGKQKKIALIFAGMILIGSIISGCVTSAPLENTVKLEFGGTLPPEVLSYFDADQLKDIEAKFVVIQGRAQETSGGLDGLFGPTVVQVAVLVTVGKDYRIVQMSKYIKPYTDSRTQQHIPGEHHRLDRIDIVPNMATKYNTLQEAQLASEMGA
ncbi:MAG: hypothetical protein LBD47_01635 [Treponema sp.]|jgi:hypothetical protein|nr:hypothetical protein [Treponema sp.]